jgi:hypothetical protein
MRVRLRLPTAVILRNERDEVARVSRRMETNAVRAAILRDDRSLTRSVSSG